MHSKPNFIVPLLSWTLRQEEEVINPLAVKVAMVVKLNAQVLTNEAVVWAVSEYLKSDEARYPSTLYLTNNENVCTKIFDHALPPMFVCVSLGSAL